MLNACKDLFVIYIHVHKIHNALGIEMNVTFISVNNVISHQNMCMPACYNLFSFEKWM